MSPYFQRIKPSIRTRNVRFRSSGSNKCRAGRLALPRCFNAAYFNGKEKDYESGFHYYGTRYYWSEVLTGWLSVDPMMDKYPGISPYNYCMWNPVNLVDPEGMDTIFSFALNSNDKEQNRKNKSILQWMRNLGDNPNLFLISMHGNPSTMEYVNNNNGRTPDDVIQMDAKKLANIIKSGWNLYTNNSSNNQQTLFILYSCETGNGDDCLGQNLSKELPLSIVFAPVGSLFTYEEGQKIDNAEAINIGTRQKPIIKKGAHREWGIFMNGKLVMTFSHPAPQAWINKCGGINNVIKMVNNIYKSNKALNKIIHHENKKN